VGKGGPGIAVFGTVLLPPLPTLSDRAALLTTDITYLNVAAPIGRQQSLFDVSVKTAVRPILDLQNMSMLDRVVVNVIDVTRQIVVAANRVLPVTPLPDAFIALFDLASGAQLRAGESTRKFAFLVRLQRRGKFKSPAGNDQIACR
jgi:hypothetical protein